MKYKDSDYFILSSACRVTKGYNRSLIQDFQRNNINIIPNDYYELIQIINRKKISSTLDMIEEDSMPHCREFLDFMADKEYALFVDDLSRFPEKSNALHDEHILLKDAIIEVDEVIFKEHNFRHILEQLDLLSCEDIQIRFLSESSIDFINKVIEITQSFDFLYVEVHIQNTLIITQQHCLDILENAASVSKIYLYNQDSNQLFDHVIKREGHYPLLMGYIISVTHPLHEDTCGIITYDSLSFRDEKKFDLHTKYNGCLYKKISVDKFGNLKNCPYTKDKFNHLGEQSFLSIINSKEFQEKWLIKKDDIEVCKDCEFRYNCTDCRAFVADPNNMLSKPRKCGYSPYTNEWEPWAVTHLKSY